MYKAFFKRLIDLIGALIALPFVLIVIFIFGPIIYLTDRGPIFYNGERVGKGYRIFKMFKLRSMYVNAPDLRNSDGSTFNSENDPRVTPIGRFLRKTSLDEFPQFLNVLIGDMSLIGPRPILPKKDYSEMKIYLDDMMKIRPGVTGYNQAYFRNSVSRLEKYQNDAYYAKNLSFWMDVKIILKTFTSVIMRQNINTNTEKS